MGEHFFILMALFNPHVIICLSHIPIPCLFAFDTQNVLKQNRNIRLKVCEMSSHTNDMLIMTSSNEQLLAEA